MTKKIEITLEGSSPTATIHDIAPGQWFTVGDSSISDIRYRTCDGAIVFNEHDIKYYPTEYFNSRKYVIVEKKVTITAN